MKKSHFGCSVFNKHWASQQRPEENKTPLGDLVKWNQNTKSIRACLNKLTFSDAADGDEAIKVCMSAVVMHRNEDRFCACGRGTVETN